MWEGAILGNGVHWGGIHLGPLMLTVYQSDVSEAMGNRAELGN